MIRLVLDTNVWLDWLVFEDTALQTTRTLVSSGQAEILIDGDCEAELARALAYPLQHRTLNAAQQASHLAECRRLTTRTSEVPATPPGLPRCKDPDDQKFLALAASCNAHWLLTRDRALLQLDHEKYGLSFHIVTPAAFAARLRVE